MPIRDLTDRALREYRRYTGDGLPNPPIGAALPIGDPASGVHNPSKAELRNAFGDAGDLIDAAKTAAETAATGAETAQTAAESAAANAAATATRGIFATVAGLLADNNSLIGYTGSGASLIVSSGGIVEAEGFRYEVAASGATDHHVVTAGGVKLYVLPTPNGRSLKAFGATGDGTTDDTAAITAWLETGGDLYVPPGTYLIAAAGADAGGVAATIAASARVVCAASAVFKAATNLDNDIIRVNCAASGYTAARNIVFEWHGGTFDQTGQRNSTSVPFSADYPPPNLGASATTDGLSIRGEVDDSGTPRAGFYRVTVKDVQILASTTDHWESAGGDSGIFIDGARHVHVSNVQAFGSRDLGIYVSGLTSGAIPGGSCYIGECAFYGCMFGASTKRQSSNVQMVHNIGYNTATVCTSSNVTTTGDNVLIADNIGYGAWRCIRATDGSGAVITGNQSFKHGHLRENGTVPVAVFGSGNACVSMEGTQKSVASNNRIVGQNTGFTSGTTMTAVRLATGAVDADDNMVHGNTADGVFGVVLEEAGGANFTECWGNRGKNLTGVAVLLDGASSLDRDGPIYETNVTVTHTGTTASTVVATGTIGAGTLNAGDRVRIIAGGTISGTAGGKTFGLKLGAGSQKNTPLFAAAIDGNWFLEGVVEISSITASQRMMASVVAENASGAILGLEAENMVTGAVDLELIFKLENAADSILLRTFSIRVE